MQYQNAFIDAEASFLALKSNLNLNFNFEEKQINSLKELWNDFKELKKDIGVSIQNKNTASLNKGQKESKYEDLSQKLNEYLSKFADKANIINEQLN